MQGPSGKVSIITVTCGAGNYIWPCLDSLKKQTLPDIETIVIDNSNNADFSRRIIELHPEVKLCPSSQNTGYCESLNKGIKMSEGDFILCLNDDTTLDERFIENAIKGFDIDREVGMVSGRVLRQDKVMIDSTGLFLSLWRTAKERGYGRRDKGQSRKEGYIFGVTGAAAFYRRAMLEAVKIDSEYFDTDYHFFYEDLDIAWRAQNCGWKGYYIPDAVAYHVRGGTARQGSGINKPYARRYLDTGLQLDLVKNRYLTIIKNESLSDFFLHLPLILFYDILTSVYLLFFRPILIIKLFSVTGYLRAAFNKREIIKLMRHEHRK